MSSRKLFDQVVNFDHLAAFVARATILEAFGNGGTGRL